MIGLCDPPAQNESENKINYAIMSNGHFMRIKPNSDYLYSTQSNVFLNIAIRLLKKQPLKLTFNPTPCFRLGI